MPTPRQYANPAERQAAYRARLAAARKQEQEAKGLPPLPAVASLPGQARWQALRRQAALLLQHAQEEMQAYYAQRSERWQDSERGEAFLERLEALQELHEAAEQLWR
jgi:hypothetical protein